MLLGNDGAALHHGVVTLARHAAVDGHLLAVLVGALVQETLAWGHTGRRGVSGDAQRSRGSEVTVCGGHHAVASGEDSGEGVAEVNCRVEREMCEELVMEEIGPAGLMKSLLTMRQCGAVLQFRLVLVSIKREVWWEMKFVVEGDANIRTNAVPVQGHCFGCIYFTVFVVTMAFGVCPDRFLVLIQLQDFTLMLLLSVTFSSANILLTISL